MEKIIYITGDTHASIDIKKLSYNNWPKGESLTKDDFLIICGDFGLPFLPTDDNELPISTSSALRSRESYLYWTKYLSELPYTVLFCDGNHDNHAFWKEQKITEWNGGRVHIHPRANNVIHLMRGEYYNIDGKTFWVMGGAHSIDKEQRTENITWWQEEIPSWEEMENGLKNLEKNNYQVDYIITHTMPDVCIKPVLHKNFVSEPTSAYLNEVYRKTDFKKWYCGHWHENKESKMYRIHTLYDDIVELKED